MLTVPEFRAAVAGARRRWWAVLAAAGGLWVAAEFALFAAAGHVPKPAWVAANLALTAGLSAAAVVLGEWWAGRDPRLRCPGGRGHLTDDPARVIATRCCPTCPRRVLADPEPADPPRPLPTAADLDAAIKAADSRRRPVSGLLAAAALVGWCGACLLAPAVAGGWAWEWVTGRPVEWPVWEWYARAFILGFLAALAAVTVGDAGRAVWLARRAELRCAWCRGRLDARLDLVTDTGNCPHCGRRAVADPPQVGAAGPPPAG